MRAAGVIGFIALIGAAMMPPEALADERRRIALTFDDAPRAAGPYQDAGKRTDSLIEALAAGRIDGAMFFATTGHLDVQGPEGEARLRRYAAAGHAIANHSHTHGSANRVAAEDFIADVALAQQRLAGYPANTPYFRFPFLNEGNTRDKRDAIRAGLETLRLKQGYVTVDNYDWYLQALFDESIRSGIPPDLEAWKAVYLEVLIGAIEHYDRMARDTLDRSPAHVLLLHENDLAALFVDDLAATLRAEGWEIISALEAYQDPLADALPDTLFLGQGRVAALAAVAGVPPRELPHPWESEEALRALAEQRGLLR